MKITVGLLLTISIIAISFSAILVKWSEAPSTIISMYRMYFACIFLLPIVWVYRKEFYRLSKKDWLIVSIAGVFLGLHFALWFASLKLTTVASSTIILSLQPIIALLVGYLIYKEKTNIFTIFTIGISIIGIVMIGWGDFEIGNKSVILGDILSLLSVLVIVVYLFIGQNILKKISHWIYSFGVFLFAAFTLTIYNFFTSTPFGGYGSQEWLVFILLAIFPTTAHVVFNYLLTFINAKTISMSVLGEPVGATVLAVILLGERINSLQIVGGILVILGVFLFLIQHIGATQEDKNNSLSAE